MATPKLHELLAAEKTAVSQVNQLLLETRKKFASPQSFFFGMVKTLKMLTDSPENSALEAAARQEKARPSTVYDTVDYVLRYWARSEDLQYQKNRTNQNARGSIEFRGKVLLADLPVDELMGLEARLTALKQVFEHMPTLDASRKWKPDPQQGEHVFVLETPEESAKTAKIVEPVVLYQATKEHPAQVKEVSRDVVVGKFSETQWSGAATAVQKAEVLSTLDELVAEVKKARMRANSTEAVTDKIAQPIVDVILGALGSK